MSQHARLVAHISKQDGLAPLDAYPHPGNSTFMHSRLVCQENNVCICSTAYLPVRLHNSYFRTNGAILRAALKTIFFMIFLCYLLPLRPWISPKGGGGGQTNRQTYITTY